MKITKPFTVKQTWSTWREQRATNIKELVILIVKGEIKLAPISIFFIFFSFFFNHQWCKMVGDQLGTWPSKRENLSVRPSSLWLNIKQSTDLLHSQGGRCKRQVSCPRWWLCWARGPAGWGLWRSFLCGKRRIPWKAGCETPPTCPAGPPQGQHTDGTTNYEVNAARTTSLLSTLLC